MTGDSQTLLDAALQLPEADRLALASCLLESLPPAATLSVDDPNLIAELDRRFADADGAVPWSDLRAAD